MKAISLHQPWAAAVATGIKWIETRSWRTHYRGPIAIHAAKTKSTDNLRAYYEVITPRAEDLFLPLNYADLPFGYIIAIADLADCFPSPEFPSKLHPSQLAVGDFSPQRFCWRLDDVRALKNPFPCKGRQGFFEVDFSPGETVPANRFYPALGKWGELTFNAAQFDADLAEQDE